MVVDGFFLDEERHLRARSHSLFSFDTQRTEALAASAGLTAFPDVRQ
jgi:hypothetical protein